MKIFTKLKIIFFFYCYFILCSSVLAKTSFVDSSLTKTSFIDSPNAPPGFELAQMNQHIRVSVVFMNQYVGFFYINLNKGQLKFQSPKQLLSQLINVKNSQDVLRLLNQSFPLNIECYENGIVQLPHYCEKLKKKSAYVIYNPREETVYLYLQSSYFKKLPEENALAFIPNPTSGWSYINKLGAAGSFSDNDPSSLSRIYSSTPNYYNLYSNNILAYENSSIIGNLSQNNGINDGQHFQVQNLYAQQIIRDKIYTGGYIVNPTSPFFQTQIIAGIGVKTTLQTVKNADAILATPLVIFIPQASQVNIFKNEQLIFSQYLEAGYQRINTSSFPDGGYELIIKIGTETQRRFFTKGFILPPLQAPQYYVMSGYLTNGMIIETDPYNFLPQFLGIPVLQAGMNKRINDRIAFLSDILLNSHQGSLDFGPTIFLGNSFIKVAGLISTKNNYGIYSMFNTQRNRLNVNLTATKIFYQNTDPDYFFLNNLVDNDSISMSYHLSECDLLSLQANYTKSLAQPHSYSAGTFYQRQVGNYKGMGFFFNAGYNKTIYIGDTYNLSLSINFSKNRLAGTESLAWQNQKNNSPNNQLAVPIVVQGSTVYSHENDQGIGYSLNEIHTISPTVYSLAGTYNYTSQQAFAATYVNYNKIKDEGHSIGYGGSLETELAVNKQGARFNGVYRGNTSGIIIEVKSHYTKDKSSKFALLDVNNRKIATLPANKKIFVSLPEFTDQNYTLVNLSKMEYFIKEPTRHITLYPGNVDYYAWRVERRIIVIGRALTKQKVPLINTWIHASKNGIYTDNEGYFQLELSQDTTVLATGNSCKIHLPKLNVDKAYLYIGDALCY